MEFELPYSRLVEIVEPAGERGAGGRTVRGIAALESAGPDDLSFLGNAKYRSRVGACRAGVILLPEDFPGEPQEDQCWLLVENPSLALTRLCDHLEREVSPHPQPGIHPTAAVAESARIDPQATIGPFCVIGERVVIGPECWLESHVHVGADVAIGRASRVGPHCSIMDRSVLGCRVRLQPGVVIGSDGYGYDTVGGRHHKSPQIGCVVVEDDVEIGANSTIDRARFAETRIGEGTKIDNLVQIGHNVKTGKHCLLVAQVGVSGSSELGDYVVLGGQAGVVGHITIGDGAQAGGQAGINSDLPPGAKVRGSPARAYLVEQRSVVLTGKLPELFKRVAKLEKDMGESPSEP